VTQVGWVGRCGALQVVAVGIRFGLVLELKAVSEEEVEKVEREDGQEWFWASVWATPSEFPVSEVVYYQKRVLCLLLTRLSVC
jgi:hypothetical protein